ncbi:MAG: repair protein RecN, partial [Thermoleophilaceae bacterium]|nr:repair protein RecN [Thermoleophilaceae bacterium]
MLLELRVENLLLIERAELRLEPGLNVITGETGAGKTVLAHALDLLLGGKPRAGIVRPGASEAYVEGVFAIPEGLLDGDALADLRERLPDDADEIVLGRRVGAEGRTRAFVQGRSASAADLRELGGRLLSFYGQHEHRRLTLSSAQLDILDAFCGPAHAELRARYAAAHARVRSVRAELSELRARAGARARDRDLLAFELDEIDNLGPEVEEERSLL